MNEIIAYNRNQQKTINYKSVFYYSIHNTFGADIISEKFLATLIIPDNAVIEKEAIFTQSNMIIGHHASIQRRLYVGFLMTGESVIMEEEVESNGDIRADVWCRFEKNVNCGGDAYLSEFTVVNGKIVVEGDLDIGKNVKLNGGFLSKGWVVVRNQLPIMVFIFLYIRELIGIGKTNEEIDKALNELFLDDEIDIEKLKEANISDILNHGGFFIIPVGAKISKGVFNIPENAVVGKNCRIDENLYCSRFEGGPDMTYVGFLRSRGDVWLAEGTKFRGEIQSSGKLIVGKNVSIIGKISAKSAVIHETSRIEGKTSCGSIRVATGDDFELADYKNKEKILSKTESYEKLKSIRNEKETVRKPKKAAEKTKAEKETEAEAEQTKADEKIAAEEKIAVEENEENESVEPSSESEPEKKDEAPKSRRQKRRAARSNKSKDDLTIVNIFTGENIEKPEERKEIPGSE